MESFKKQFNQLKPPKDSKSPEPKQEIPPSAEIFPEVPENLSKFPNSRKNQEKAEIKPGEKIFSEEELKKINKISDYCFFIKDIESRLPFLSGKKKEEAEKDLTEYKKERDESFDLAINNIKKSSEGEKLIESINLRDLEIIENAEKKGKDYSFMEISQEEKQQFDDAISRKYDSIIHLNVYLGICLTAAERIYEKILSEKRKEAGFFEEAEEKKQKYPKLTYEYFDPAEEVEKINKFSKEELKSLTSEERIKIKKERLALYKAKLAEQMVGISKINAEMEATILEGEVLNRDKLNEYLSDQAAIYKLSPIQLEKYHYALDSIESQNQVINEFAEKYANLNSKEIFKEFFGVEPLGEVEIKKYALSFFVVCKDIKDYSFLYRGKSDQEGIEKSRSTGGFANAHTRIRELRGAITVANASEINERYSSYLETIRIHEERHILYRLTKDVEKLGDYSKFKEGEGKTEKMILKETMNEDRLRIEKRAKNEIVAFLKTGAYSEYIKTNLLHRAAEGSLYDYFEKEKKYYSYPKYEKFDKELLEKAHNESRNKYEENILNALEKVDWLKEIGFSKERVIGLFAAERLDRWPKVFERFKISEEFQNKKSEAVKDIDELIKDFGDTLDYYKQRLLKEQNKPKIKKIINATLLKLQNKFAETKKMSEEEILESDVKRTQQHHEELLNRKKEYEKI